MCMYLKILFHEREFFFLSVIFAERGTSVKSHATHAIERGISVEVAWILRGFCEELACVLRGFCEELNPFFV